MQDGSASPDPCPTKVAVHFPRPCSVIAFAPREPVTARLFLQPSPSGHICGRQRCFSIPHGVTVSRRPGIVVRVIQFVVSFPLSFPRPLWEFCPVSRANTPISRDRRPEFLESYQACYETLGTYAANPAYQHRLPDFRQPLIDRYPHHFRPFPAARRIRK